MRTAARAILWVDSDDQAALIGDFLRESSAPTESLRVNSASELIAQLATGDIGLIVCGACGDAADERLRALPAPQSRDGVPLIVVTDAFERIAGEALRLRALLCPNRAGTELKRAIETASEQRHEHTRRVKARAFEESCRQVLELTANGAPLSEVLDRIVRLIEQQAEGMACSILLVDPKTQTLQHGAAPSLPLEFQRVINGYRIGPNVGTCGAAAYLRKRVIIEDLWTHENWAPERELPRRMGLRSGWSTPIISNDGVVLGTFAMYYYERRRPNEEELAWVDRATHLAQIALARDRAEHALRESEKRYRQLIDTAYEGVWLLDGDARTIFVNARAAELFGCSVEEMMGRRLFEFMDDEGREQAELGMLRRKQSISEQHEFQFRRKDGSELWAIVAGSPVHDENGAVVGALGMLTDITPQKRAEATLRRSEAEYRIIFENAGIGIALVDLQGRLRKSNPTLQRVLGYSEAELTGLEFSQFTHPDDVSADFALFERALRGEIDSYRLQKRFIRKDGAIVWAELTASIVRFSPEEPLLAVGMVEDITQRKLAAERIESQAALLDQAKDAILVRDFDGHVQYWNKGAERLYGWSAADAVGRKVADLIYTDPRQLDAAQARLDQQGAWNGELVQRTRTGSELVVEASWTLLRDQAGHPERVLAINSDITERKKLETQILFAQRLESVGTLAGGIAHDFNNILAAIVANVALATSDLESGHPARQALLEINQASMRAAALVKQILAFSRPRTTERRLVDLAGITSEALQLLRATLPASVRIDSEFAGDAPEIFADPTQVHQVLMNLGTNAAYAMRQRGGVLRVRTERAVVTASPSGAYNELRPGVYAKLIVSDTGSGMDSETLARIFDPFFTTKETGKGTGLGLSVVHGVMRSHEGAITVKSTVGVGSEFAAYFPAASTAEDAASRRSLRPGPGNGQRVLCIDDEEAIVRVMVRLLERLGYQSEGYTDAQRALAALSADPERFQVVLTDCTMPGTWGTELVRQILAIRRLPIIMTSGRIDSDLQDALRELGVREFLAKPGTLDNLARALERVLRER